MNPQLDWLNDQINRMQAGRSLQPPPDYMLDDDLGENLAVLQMAAQLNSLRPGAMRPNAEFIASLRGRVIAACEEEGRWTIDGGSIVHRPSSTFHGHISCCNERQNPKEEN